MSILYLSIPCSALLPRGDRFPRSVVDALKEDLGQHGTAGQLQQRPQPLGGGIIKAGWWQTWPNDKPLPPALHVFASVDTAFSEKDHEKAAYSARTTWMVFEDQKTGRHGLLLLSAWWERVGYPGLRKHVREHHLKAQLDCTLIERKASGISLLQDLRRIRRPRLNVRGFDPGRLDKVGRAYVASPMFEAGLVYAPDREWARQVITLVSSFPTGAPPSADLTDTVTQAVMYTKRRSWAQPPDEDEPDYKPEKHSEEWEEDHAEQTTRRPAYG
jgi:predicted phage terminase large subunit-like protein